MNGTKTEVIIAKIIEADLFISKEKNDKSFDVHEHDTKTIHDNKSTSVNPNQWTTAARHCWKQIISNLDWNILKGGALIHDHNWYKR